ncbi:hypothetical protein A3SI_07644 [Nitritalea halalkaliphila LW7]|uniref:Transmembrane protein n=1 Tax=Nitritalea halalkaliphila LW7 TaxID=1189621 RepID=I5C5P6_9BACT|nr:phage holin family protein [Nitritalea halalkaliphila]EIM77148.1 hypothetical protein A3SI_07644 [Nitritalea halalkaliphila LW7]
MFNIAEIVQTVKQLIEVRLQLLKNEVEDQVSSLIARIFILVTMGLAGLMVLLFMSLWLAFFIGEKLYSPSMGFLYVGLIYTLLFILLYIIRDSEGFIQSFKDFFRRFLFLFQKKKP